MCVVDKMPQSEWVRRPERRGEQLGDQHGVQEGKIHGHRQRKAVLPRMPCSGEVEQAQNEET